MKHDIDKYDPSLTYTSLLTEISKVRKHGKEKYGSYDNWKTTKIIQHLNAAIRHIRDVIDGEDSDKGSGYLHLSHAACNIMFEIERFLNTDDGEVNEIKNACLDCGKQLELHEVDYTRCSLCRVDKIRKERLELEKMDKR